MAKKEIQPTVKRVYNVPLRKEWLKVPRYKRSKKAVKALKEFLMKHMKTDNVKLGRYVNELVWKHGIRNPPHHVKVEVEKNAEGMAFAELIGAPKPVVPEPKKGKKVEEKKDAKPEAKKAKREEPDEKESLEAQIEEEVKKDEQKPEPAKKAAPKKKAAAKKEEENPEEQKKAPAKKAPHEKKEEKREVPAEKEEPAEDKE